jgi:septal ring factor EnvC (AmiA/AmiB activator)
MMEQTLMTLLLNARKANSIYFSNLNKYVLLFVLKFINYSLLLTEPSWNQVKSLEDELQMLRDEVEQLRNEHAQKKEQMKQLYESFNKEKSELKESLESVSVYKWSIIPKIAFGEILVT